MKRLWLALVVVGLVVSLPGVAEAKTCKIEGLWYGHNSYGQDFTLTITKMAGGRYTALAMNPDTYSQGVLVSKGRGKFHATWMTYFIDEAGQWLALYMHGETTLTSCNTLEAVTQWDIYAFNPGAGEDPLVDGFPVGSWPGMILSYKRVP